MKNASIGILLLAALALVCLAGASPCLAYYPPLQNVTGPTVEEDPDYTIRVTVSVHNPATGQDIPHVWTVNFGTPTHVDQITKSQGIVAWRVNWETFYIIVWGVYDPGRALPGNPGAGWIFAVSPWVGEPNILALHDGILLFQYQLDVSGPYFQEWWTYDPTPSPGFGWKCFSSDSGPGYAPPWGHVVKDGVAAYVREVIGGGIEVRCLLYDVSKHNWFYTSVNAVWPTAPGIVDATVIWTDDGQEMKLGYDHTDQAWHSDFDTLIFPYFVFAPLQPQVGQPVYFTDASIAATSWNWDLGEGLPSTSRSLYHTYAKPGNYEVYQTVEGPAGSDFYGRTVPVKGSGIAPIMLLLGN